MFINGQCEYVIIYFQRILASLHSNGDAIYLCTLSAYVGGGMYRSLLQWQFQINIMHTNISHFYQNISNSESNTEVTEHEMNTHRP